MKKTRIKITRQAEILRIRGNMERDGFPRLRMFLLVTLTGAVGFIASFLLLHGGLLMMWLRYLLSFGVAYLAFLGLLWLWLRTRDSEDVDLSDAFDTMDIGGDVVRSGVDFSGSGGHFGGGGASGDFSSALVDTGGGEASSLLGDTLSASGDAEELAIPLLVILLVGAILLSSAFLIYSAPMLFAELLVDGVLSARLYKRLRGLETRFWLETAIRKTALPFLLTALVVAGAGWGMSRYAPEAHSIGQVLLHAHSQSTQAP